MKFIISLLTALSMSIPAQANCDKPVVTVEKGTPAPCRGFLFSPEKEAEVRIVNEDYKIQKQEIQLKDLKINYLMRDIKDTEFIIDKERQQAELWRQAAEKSTLQLVKKQEGQGKRDWLFLMLGVLITVGAGHAVGEASK